MKTNNFGLLRLLLPIIFALCHLSAFAQATSVPASPPAASANVAVPSKPLAERTYDIEKAKLEEQQFSTKLTLFTILVTGILGFATIAYNLRNANKQAQLQAKLKAIDVVISAAGPNSARERLIVVGKLLGSDLVLETKPEDLDAAGIGAGHDQNRKDLIKMLIDNPTRQLEVLDLWQTVFAKTNLGKNMRDLREYVEKRQKDEK